MTTWLSDASANRHIKTYVKDFLDLSGNMTVRNTNDYAWNNYGQVISGPYEGDNVYFGVSVGMDVSGLTIVVGASSQNTGSTDAGAVTAYRYDTSAEIWYQLGNTITETNGNQFGYNLDMNDSGTRIMVTDPNADFVNVYDYNSSTNTWDKQVSITSHGVDAYAGRISGDGNTIVFGDFSDNTNTGKQYVYRNTSGTTWTKIGEFTGESTYSYFGMGASLTYDGNRVSMLRHTHDFDADGNAASNIGKVEVYDYSGSGTTWTLVGNALYGDDAGDILGDTTDFSKDGSIVAIGTTTDCYVKVYQYDATVDGSWNLLGTTIRGPTGNAFAFGLRLSDDGTVLLVNDQNDDTAGSDNGALYIYKYTNGDWVQQGSTLYSQYDAACLGFRNGNALAISGDGSKIVAGGLFSNVNDPDKDTGHVQAWQWSQKYNTQPALDISGGTMTMWGGAEHVVANYSVTQLGSTLSGASSGIQFGNSMDMDSTGTIWAIGDNYNTNYGSVSVYKYQNGGWYQLGSTLYGRSEDYLADDISISGDGKVLVLSALAYGGLYTSGGTRVYGYVNTYRYVNGDWVLFGETSGYNTSVSIVPTNNHTTATYWGSLVSTNNDGTVVAINEKNGSGKGGIWRYDSSSDSWNNEHLFGHNTSDVAISRDGTRVVTGYEGADINVTNDGSIRVYDYNSNTQTWSQVGSTITGYETQDRIGYSVAISGDGNTFFQCASNESSDGNSYGQVYTYVQDASGGDGDWVQKGPDFVGTTSIRYGLGSSLDYDGDTLILGSPNVDYSRVYKYLDGYWQQIGDNIDFDGSTGQSTAVNDAGTIFAVGSSGTTNGTAVAYNLTNNPALKIEDGKINGISVGAGSGTQDIAIGYNANASSSYGTAIGQNTIAGPNSVAIGESANSYHASQTKQVAIGAYATATGQQGIAVGGHANAVGTQSVSLGYACNAYQTQCIAIGLYAVSGSSTSTTSNTCIAIGYGANTADGAYNVAIGPNTYAGNQSTAIGWYSSASGYLSAALGRSAVASAANSIAIGYGADATAINTVAIGMDAQATSDYSVALGAQTRCTSGGQATALGFQADALGYRSVAIGAYAYTSEANTIQLGTSGHTVKCSNYFYHAGLYQTGGYITGNEGFLRWGTNSSSNAYVYWRFDWYSSPNCRIYLVNLSGDHKCDVYAKSFNNVSDDRTKINEKLITNATETLMKLRPQTYDQYGNMDCSGETHPHAGLIAQEVHYQAPELRDYVISYPKDISLNDIQDIDINNIDIQNDPDYEALGWGKEATGVNYTALIPYLIRSNQEQQEEINTLKSQITDLLARVSSLESA